MKFNIILNELRSLNSFLVMNNLINKISNKIFLSLKTRIEKAESNQKYASFLANANIHPSVKIFPSAAIMNLRHRSDLINIDQDAVILGELFVFAHAGKISIGKGSYIGQGTKIWSSDSIDIGDRVYISHNVNIHDTNSHSLDAYLRNKHAVAIMSTGHPKENLFDIKASPVVIEDDVWIGFNSTILKGVTIGKGSIIAACSVVTKNVPPNVMVAGNPSRIIKDIA